MKRMYLICVSCIMFLLFTGCSNIQPIEESTESYTIEDETAYPMDENGCVDTEYAEKILEKKSKDLELSKIEEGIIDFFFLEGENGMAVVDMHGIGMQKVVLKIYSTLNSGETWQLVKDDLYLMSGYTDCMFLKDKLLFSNYASVVEKTAMFFVDLSGTETHMPDEFYDSHNFENYRLQAKFEYQPQEDKVVCFWYEDYDFENIKHKTVYDINLNLIEGE